jgi:hypothetical protein
LLAKAPRAPVSFDIRPEVMRPRIDAKYFQERAGVHKVAILLTSIGLVFRETSNADVGIDGYVELVDESGEATGATVAVQIKSGSSYLRDGGDFWRYYPEEKHRCYWEMYPLPVVLMLHDPTDDRVYWADVRRQLRSDQHSDAFLSISKHSYLSRDSQRALFESCGTAGEGLLTPRDALKHLALTQNANACFPVSHLDLFLEGLTDIGRKIFFSAGMCWDLAESRLGGDAPTGVGMGSEEQRFLDLYLRFLVEQSLAHIDYSDVLIDLYDRQMFPTLLVPLTSRGRDVRDLCREIGSCGSGYEITEASVGLMFTPSHPLRGDANSAVASKVVEYFKSQRGV